MILSVTSTLFFFASLHQAECTLSSPQHIFANPEIDSTSTLYHIPSIRESAIQARRIVNLSSIATLSTIFPAASDATYSTSENRPVDVAGAPIGLIDYYASCGPSPYNPTILAISIATSIRNARAGSNVTFSLRYRPPLDHPPSKDPFTYSPANLPRLSLIGYIKPLSQGEVQDYDIKPCFLARHPDAELWTPGNIIHDSWWATLVVKEIYLVGGFGDRAYIGWIPAGVYQAITEAEVRDARLVGEKGWIEKITGEL